MIRASPLRRHLASTLSQQHIRSQVARPANASTPRRLASTASGPNARSSWKSFFLRLGLAGGAVYYYNTSPLFGNEVPLPPLHKPEPEPAPPTLASLAPKRSTASAPQQTSTLAIPSDIPVEEAPLASTPTSEAGGAAALEAEASQQGAFNEETGEINWDCPCLGGMAYGPCGAQFREAFSCFVFSEAEPKGMDCVDKFKNMQDCFRAHPDVYGAELEDDEDAAAPPAASAADTPPSDDLVSQAQSNIAPNEQLERAQDSLADAGDAIKAKAVQARDAAQQTAAEAGAVARERTHVVADKAAAATERAKGKAEEVQETVVGAAETIAQTVREKVAGVKDPRTSA